MDLNENSRDFLSEPNGKILISVETLIKDIQLAALEDTEFEFWEIKSLLCDFNPFEAFNADIFRTMFLQISTYRTMSSETLM